MKILLSSTQWKARTGTFCSVCLPALHHWRGTEDARRYVGGDPVLSAIVFWVAYTTQKTIALNPGMDANAVVEERMEVVDDGNVVDNFLSEDKGQDWQSRSCMGNNMCRRIFTAKLTVLLTCERPSVNRKRWIADILLYMYAWNSSILRRRRTKCSLGGLKK